MGLLERGPYALATGSGAFLAHGGFPRGLLPSPWSNAVDGRSEQRLIELVWSECTASRSRRGAIEPWTVGDLDGFLNQSGLTLFLRGHDPDLTGRALYSGRCLTLQTTRIYEQFGGVIVARLPLGSPVRSTDDLSIEHLPTEGRSYPEPE
jgi:serine/threonine-protein phosphatase 2A catalytic subunit